MPKQMPSKKIIITIAAAAVIILAAVVMLLSKKEEAYRSILVYELEGNAVIERTDIGEIDAAENLYLESGDRVSVKEESMMRMKLDGDKYITAEENTVFSLEAKGSEQASKTRINLEQGAITNEIQNALSKDSLYETATPNSVMAVRGTVYRAQLYDDGEGGQDMRLCCFQGTVAATPVLPDGTFGDEVLVNAGSELTVYSDGTADDIKEIDFSTLPKQAVQTLVALSENGTAVTGITSEELSAILSSKQGEAGISKESSEAGEAAQETHEADADGTDEAASDEKASEEKAADGNALQGNSGNNADKKDDRKKQTDKNKVNGTEDKTKQESKKPSQTAENPSADSESSDSEDGNSGSDSGSPQDKGSDGSSGNKPGKPSKTVTYTVTYKYQGSVFATQTVKKGNKAAAPMLTPAKEGAWDFDFDKKITADTTIEWK